MANQGNLLVTLLGALVVGSIGGFVGRMGLDERIDERLESSRLSKTLAALDVQVAGLKSVTSSRAVLEAKSPDGSDVVSRLAFLEREVKNAVQKAERAHLRLNQARIAADQTLVGDAYGCGASDVQETPYVMVGIRDGSGCGVQNQNYYRKLSLAIPAE